MKEQTNKREHGLSPDFRASQISSEDIRAQLDHVLSSPDSKAPRRVNTIFRYLTEEPLTGSEDQINALSTADNSPKRPLDPDPSIDPLVRIKVNQIRRALKRYEAEADRRNR